MKNKKDNADEPARSNGTAFPDSARIREKAMKKAQTSQLPDPQSMTNEEIRQQLYEMHVKQVETEMYAAQLRSALTEYGDQLALLRLIAENMLDMVVLSNPEGNITFAGKSTEILGYGPDVLIGKNVIDFVHPEDRNRVLAAYEEFVAGDDTARIQFRCRCRDGTYLWVETRGASVKNENGSLEKIVLSLREITERKRMEDALREQTELFQKISDNMFDLISIADMEGNYKYIGSSQNLLGYDPEALIDKNFLEFIHPDDVDEIISAFAEALEKGVKVKRVEYRYKKADGEYVWLETIGKVIDGQSGESGEIIFSTRDITERKQAEEVLAEQHSMIKAIYGNAPLIMMVVDADRRLRQVNGFATKFAGRPAGEMLGLRGGEALRCLHASDDPEGCGFGEFCKDCGIRKKVLDTLENGVSNLQIEVPFDFSSGGKTQTLTLLVSTTPIPFYGENMALVTMLDITERKQAEKEQEQLQAQLSQAQKMESVGRLAGGVAHDFNNMLSIINGYAEMSIEMLDPAEPLYDNIREIYNAGRRSADIVRQLLAFARQQTINPVQLDLNNTISSLLKMLQRLIGENIDLAWHPGNNLWIVKIDPSQLNQVMANLVINARDAMPDVGKLTIETRNIVVDEDYCKVNAYFVPGKYVMLVVSDNGCGMDKKTLENLFEPFFTTKGAGKGTGLGLPTVYGIVKQNSGFINVYSEHGKGTTFKIYLPAHTTRESASIAQKESPKDMPGGSETVLIVEDESAILRLARSMLENRGYMVLSAENPNEALATAKAYNGEIHLLITDVIMPEMNGRDLASQLVIARPALKILYMSGYTADVIAHHGVLDEGVAFIQKPFSMQELAIKVREGIDQK